MSRFLAIEWDSREARLAVASSRGSDIVVEHAFSVPLPPREEGKAVADKLIGEKIAAGLADARVRLTDALVAVGRSNIELKQLTFPPVPDDELPDMVRWQATREFHSLGDNWPLDYMPLAGGPADNRTVLAAAMSPELLAQMQETCTAAGLKPQRLVLRPSAAASLFLRTPEAAQHQIRLLVDLMADEADLTVLVDRDAVFLRTARLPGDVLSTPENCKPLLGEIRRTLAAAQNQLGGRKIEAIFLCGTQAEHTAVVGRIEQELGLPARLFDPMSGLKLDAGLKGKQPENIGRFAPLLGMLVDELENVPHGMDFLRPRRAPTPPSKRNTYALAGLAAVALVGAVSLFAWQRLASLDAEIVQLAAQSKSLNEEVTKARERERVVAEIKQWGVNDLVWLDELRELSQEFPDSKEAMLTHLRFGRHNDGGEMTLEGLVREASVVDQLEQRLRDERHAVEGRGRQQDKQRKEYSWQFKSAVVVKPMTGETKAPPVRQAAAKPAGARGAEAR